MKHRPSILIVDDEEVVRLSHLRSLARAGYQAEAVNDGNEALQILQRRPVDLVFLDLRMPEMDGITLLKTIRENWPECEVVVVTGYPSVETAKEAVKLGAYHYLVKPVAPGEFVKLANDALMHKAWALRTDELANTRIASLCRHPFLEELSGRKTPNYFTKQGEI